MIHVFRLNVHVHTAIIKIQCKDEIMVKRFSAVLFACLMLLLLFVNIILCAVQLFPLAFLKFIFPFKRGKDLLNRALIRVANNWVLLNSMAMEYWFPVEWNVTGLDMLKKDDWYLVISNHQSWVDIIVLQKALYGRIPYIKFFLKRELIWVPVLGLAWWALDFPFMKRYTKEEISRNPALKGKDIEITRKACRKFKDVPIAIMTFPEGSRFTQEKHDRQDPPFKYLLKAKSGGLSFTISSMGEYINKLINVTIVYPDGPNSLWDFLCRRIRKVDVVVEILPIPGRFANGDVDDEEFQKDFNGWLNSLWTHKDVLIHKIKGVEPSYKPHLDKKTTAV